MSTSLQGLSHQARDAKSWPFEQARVLLARILRLRLTDAERDLAASLIAQGKAAEAVRTFEALQKPVVFQCGYGASGLPHMGTFGEAARHSRPGDEEEAAAEALAEQAAAGEDVGSEDVAALQDAPMDDEDSTNPSGSRAPAPERIPVDDSQREGGELLNDIPLQVAVELARVPVSAEQVVSLRVGQVIDLNRIPGEPVELSVNGKIVARGELVEVEGHLGVRILSMAG